MDRILQTLEATEGPLRTAAAVGELLAHSPAGPTVLLHHVAQAQSLAIGEAKKA